MILSAAQGNKPQLQCIYFSGWKEIWGENRLRNNHLVFKMPDTSDEQNSFSLHFIIPPGRDERMRKKNLLLP